MERVKRVKRWMIKHLGISNFGSFIYSFDKGLCVCRRGLKANSFGTSSQRLFVRVYPQMYT